MYGNDVVAALMIIVSVSAGFFLICFLVLFPFLDANGSVCSTAKYMSQECSAFEEVGNIDGAGEEVENPDILFSFSTTAEEEDKDLEAISLKMSENGKDHYYRVVMEHEKSGYKVVTKKDMTKEEAFKDRLVKH